MFQCGSEDLVKVHNTAIDNYCTGFNVVILVTWL